MTAARELAVGCYPAHGSKKLKLAFDHPIHHLYSHSLELIVKSLLLQQGYRIEELKSPKKFGHDLNKLYSNLDTKWITKFDQDRLIKMACDHYSQLRAAQFYSYPSNKHFAEYNLELADRTLSVFLIDEAEIKRIFNEPKGVDPKVLKLIEDNSQPLM